MTGQFCMSVERIYVEAPVAAEFTAKVVEKVGRLRVGPNGADAEIDFGPFTSPRQIEIVERHVGTRRGGVASLRHFCVPQAILGEGSRRKREPVWFPYSTRQARVVERMLGLLFG
jgi:hypothetical protein